MIEYRLDRDALLDVLGQWNTFLKRKVHLIACGGTALTLLGVKESTKDVDFMVPIEPEHRYLTKTLKALGYQKRTGSGWGRQGDSFVYDLFVGNRIHTTELFASPLKEGNHKLLREFSHLYVGILNEYDLIASKLFRGLEVDFEDCLMLIRARGKEIDIKRVESHSRELAQYDVSVDRILPRVEYFMDLLRREGLYG